MKLRSCHKCTTNGSDFQLGLPAVPTRVSACSREEGEAPLFLPSRFARWAGAPRFARLALCSRRQVGRVPSGVWCVLLGSLGLPTPVGFGSVPRVVLVRVLRLPLPTLLALVVRGLGVSAEVVVAVVALCPCVLPLVLSVLVASEPLTGTVPFGVESASVFRLLLGERSRALGVCHEAPCESCVLACAFGNEAQVGGHLGERGDSWVGGDGMDGRVFAWLVRLDERLCLCGNLPHGVCPITEVGGRLACKCTVDRCWEHDELLCRGDLPPDKQRVPRVGQASQVTCRAHPSHSAQGRLLPSGAPHYLPTLPLYDTSFR